MLNYFSLVRIGLGLTSIASKSVVQNGIIMENFRMEFFTVKNFKTCKLP